MMTTMEMSGSVGEQWGKDFSNVKKVLVMAAHNTVDE